MASEKRRNEMNQFRDPTFNLQAGNYSYRLRVNASRNGAVGEIGSSAW